MDNPPTQSTQLRILLLKYLLFSGKSSIDAFVKWDQQINFDDLDMESFKLLPLIYLKLLKDKMQSCALLKIKGIYRRTWTENKILLEYLSKIFKALNENELPFVISCESLRLIEIFDDYGVFSLENFSILALFANRKEIYQRFNQNSWEIGDEIINKTRFKRDDYYSLNILWVTDKQLDFSLENSDSILIGDKLQRVLCCEEQILNLCKNQYLVSGRENIEWQIIVSKLFSVGKINTEKLYLYASDRYLSHSLAEMIQILKTQFDVEISGGLINKLLQNKKNNRIFIATQKIQNFRQTYKNYNAYTNQSISIFGFIKLLEKRWNTKSYHSLIKHLVKSGIKLLFKR